MLNNLLKANLIEILELKRSKKIKPNGQSKLLQISLFD
jgi:hypothetical protein